jgi:hypothetical protein
MIRAMCTGQTEKSRQHRDGVDQPYAARRARRNPSEETLP